MKRVIGLPLALLLAIALPACGGGKSKGAGAAGIVPKDAIAFISVALSPSSSQKSDVQDVVSKFETQVSQSETPGKRKPPRRRRGSDAG